MLLHSLHIHKGITDTQVAQLVDYSLHDPVILQHAPNDTTRFGSKKMYDQWKQKGRTVYVLTNDTGDLLGMVWFGMRTHHTLPHHGITFAIRLYANARGKGYALPFMQEAMHLYKQSDDFTTIPHDVRHIWLETDIDNPRAISLYTSYGFKEIERDDKRILMVEQ